jgi:hypothetical protein
LAVAYGVDPLGVRIRIAFGANPVSDPAGWVWTDVTQWWHLPDDVSIGWGRSSGADQAETSTLSLTLKNTDGRFTAMDPRSPYWPNVIKWVPISYDVDLGDGAGWRNRYSGFVRRWPLTWPGASSGQALARIEAVGTLGRSGRGKPPTRSALRRSIAGSGALAYWPAEDGEVSTQVGSAIPGVPALTLTGAVKFVAVDQLNISGDGAGFSLYGTKALLDLAAGGSLAGTVPASVTAATATAQTVHTLARVTATGISRDMVLMEWDTPGGTYTRWQLVLTAGLHTQVIAYTAAGAATNVIDIAFVNVTFRVWNVSAWQSGGTIQVGLGWVGATIDAYDFTGSVAGTLAGITGIRVNPTGATITGDEIPVGHIAIWGQQPVPYSTDGDYDSYGFFVRDAVADTYIGEAAHLRLARLAAEDGLPVTITPVADAAAVTRMGFQAPGTSLDLYRECEASDQGLIYEAGFGLGYLPRDARYGAPVALTIDAAAGQLGMPFEPVDDDTLLRNAWSVERTGGSSATAIDQASIDLQGEIEGSAKVNLSGDGPLADHAAWRLRQTTVQEPRYPAVSINLAAHPELAAAWCACKPGSRINVINPPKQNVPGTVDQLVVGGKETFKGRRSWKATLNLQPARPWDVAVADGTQRVAADGSTLAALLAAGGTTISLASTAANGIWTTDLADYPLPVRVGGERVTVGAPGAVLNANAFLTVDASGWVGSNSTIVRSTAQQYDAAYGSLRVTPDGIGASGGANATARVAVTALAQYRLSVWVYATATILLEPAADWHTATSGGTFVSTGFGGAVSVPAGAWTLLSAVLTAPATAAGALMRARHSGTPASTDVWYATAIVLIPTSTYLTSPQTMTVVPGGRTLTRSWPAGTPVDVADPAIVPL